MRNAVVCLLLILPIQWIAGCRHTVTQRPGEYIAAERTYQKSVLEALLPAVTSIEAEYQRSHQVEGVAFVARVPEQGASPRYASDADNAIFTGMALAAASYRYGATASAADLTAVERALAGVHLLTHVSPVPGVLARWAFPLENAWSQIGYDPIESSAPGNQWGKRMRAGQVYEHAGHAFYTRTTRDQLSGIVFGLAVAHEVVDAPRVRDRVAEITRSLITQLEETGWSLADHAGRTGTNAHRVDAPLRLALEALDHATSGRQDTKPSSAFFRNLAINTLYYNRCITRTFVWNLHAMNAHTLLLLRDHHREEAGVRRWEEKLWRFIAADENPHFAALHVSFSGEPVSRVVLQNLQRRARENYPGFFSWEKDPDEWWHRERNVQGPGLDVLLPYWMLRYYDRLGV